MIRLQTGKYANENEIHGGGLTAEIKEKRGFEHELQGYISVLA